MSELLSTARALDDADPLASFLAAFAEAEGVSAYLDGNSLGRPLKDLPDRLAAFVRQDWGTRLIRSWDEQWMRLPTALGDRIGALCLGAAAGQTIVADSTTVLLYKLIRAAVDARPDRSEIVIEEGNFPTDRFVVEGVAADRGLSVRWIAADPVHGVQPEDIAPAVSAQTALVVLSHVDYRSGALADMAEITRIAHGAGALVLWDLCHSVGAVPVQLDDAGVDLAVGCTYKYLNGGPGAPAFAYVRSAHQGVLRQPIQGWMGAADVFAMGTGYAPDAGIRQFISGTPPVLGMLAMQGMLDLIEQASIEAVRAKSQALTSFAVEAFDEALAPLGARLLSPRDAAARGGHITIGHPAAQRATETLWEGGVIPDFRFPDGIRLGLSPLSTSFDEVARGVLAVRAALTA